MKIKTVLIIVIIMTAIITLASGCGSQTPAATVDGNTVIMEGHKYIPAELTIKKGETVTWTNKDSAKHDVTGAAFKSDLLAQDQSFEQTFNEVGTFEYSCTPHPYMKGKIIVTE